MEVKFELFSSLTGLYGSHSVFLKLVYFGGAAIRFLTLSVSLILIMNSTEDWSSTSRVYLVLVFLFLKTLFCFILILMEFVILLN